MLFRSCNELVQLLATTAVFPPPTSPAQAGMFPSNNWWPADLGVPSSAGGQNDVRYAFFPGTRRLAIQIGGVTRIFDTGEHHIGGVQQQQGGGYGSVSFTSQFGTFGVASLRDLGAQPAAQTPAATPAPAPAAAQAPPHQPPSQSQYQSSPPPQFAPQIPKPASGPSDDAAAIVAAIESLAGLHQRGILSDEEFATKKAELLSRL